MTNLGRVECVVLGSHVMEPGGVRWWRPPAHWPLVSLVVAAATPARPSGTQPSRSHISEQPRFFSSCSRYIRFYYCGLIKTLQVSAVRCDKV